PGTDGTPVEFTYKELGLAYPFVVNGTYQEKFRIPNPEFRKLMKAQQGQPGANMNTPGAGPYAGQGAGMGPGMGPNQLGPEGMIIEREGLPDVPQYFEAPKYNFKVQLVWREQPLSAPDQL